MYWFSVFACFGGFRLGLGFLVILVSWLVLGFVWLVCFVCGLVLGFLFQIQDVKRF